MRFFLLWGALLWVLATMIVRLVGQYMIDPERPVVMALMFLAVPFLIIAVTYPVYRWRRVSLPDRPLAALLTTLPGMLLNVFTVLFFSTVFGNMEEGSVFYFAAILLWAYSLLLTTGFISEPQARRL